MPVYPKADAGGGLDSGIIAIWHGTIANIPAGFVICDGNNSTPNLLTRFIQGVATAVTNPGAVGGAATVTLAIADIPSHDHDILKVLAVDGVDTITSFLGDRSQQDSGGDTGLRGGDGAHENEPTFYDVAFIMKT